MNSTIVPAFSAPCPLRVGGSVVIRRLLCCFSSVPRQPIVGVVLFTVFIKVARYSWLSSARRVDLKNYHSMLIAAEARNFHVSAIPSSINTDSSIVCFCALLHVSIKFETYLQLIVSFLFDDDAAAAFLHFDHTEHQLLHHCDAVLRFLSAACYGKKHPLWFV